eukprot:TRINITY_DN9384_c0_g1_i1.p1 TRINITY_DN9384_c0_g1~~TRINITY_DN9384_c0_g1_i1.p1  ORF type:complete len:452 (+),score=63.10 TRINITY_DN9384_c0_g1_i1:98-1357(+)
MATVHNIRKLIMYSTVAGGVYGIRKLLRIGETIELEGGISGNPMPMFKSGGLPNDFIEKVAAKTRSTTDPNVVVNTSSLFGDNGYLYRRMDFTFFNNEDTVLMPFQTLMKCKNEIEDDDESWIQEPCIPDYKHVLPFYLRNMCKPLLIAEKCLGNIKKDKPSRALVLGLGGGAFPGLLQELYPLMDIDVVEIEPQVVNHAVSYFGFKPRNTESASTTVIVQEASKFLANKAGQIASESEHPYDIAIVDMYVDGRPPEALLRPSFYECLKSCMAPVSCTGIHMNSRDKSNIRMWETIQSSYGTKACVLRSTPTLEPAPSVVFAHSGWTISDPLNFSSLRLYYLAREWSFENNMSFDLSRRMYNSATPHFPGLESHFFRSRIDQTNNEVSTSSSSKEEISALRREIEEKRKQLESAQTQSK